MNDQSLRLVFVSISDIWTSKCQSLILASSTEIMQVDNYSGLHAVIDKAFNFR
jgi:hypothetical protein